MWPLRQMRPGNAHSGKTTWIHELEGDEENRERERERERPSCVPPSPSFFPLLSKAVQSKAVGRWRRLLRIEVWTGNTQWVELTIILHEPPIWNSRDGQNLFLEIHRVSVIRSSDIWSFRLFGQFLAVPEWNGISYNISDLWSFMVKISDIWSIFMGKFKPNRV